jgi:hypothetical protein
MTYAGPQTDLRIKLSPTLFFALSNVSSGACANLKAVPSTPQGAYGNLVTINDFYSSSSNLAFAQVVNIYWVGAETYCCFLSLKWRPLFNYMMFSLSKQARTNTFPVVLFLQFIVLPSRWFFHSFRPQFQF